MGGIGVSRVRAAARLIRDHLPTLLPASVARRFVVQADAARDAQQFDVAAALLGEALRFTPDNGRIHLQRAHMLRQLQDFAAADHHYARARALLPPSAELSMQVGHFHKMAGEPLEARAFYEDAFRRRSGGADPVKDTADGGSIIPSLLPRPGSSPSVLGRDRIHIMRLGGSRVPYRGRMVRALRGIEAIRGFIISSTLVERLDLLVDGQVVRTEPLVAAPQDGPVERTKYPFNLWHDFSGTGTGQREITLRFMLGNGRSRLHQSRILIVESSSGTSLPDSDGFIPLEPNQSADLITRINALPSMVRPVERSPLPHLIRSILVQRTDQLGDLVCSVPAIRRLRELFPDARLVGLLTGANADLGQSLGLFDNIVIADFAESPIERRTMSEERQRELRLALQAYRFDIAIDLGEGSDSRALLLLAGARYLYGFKEREAPWLSAGLELNGHDPINGLETIPPSRKMLALVEALGALHQESATAMPRSDLDRDALDKYGVRPERPFIVLHAGARLSYSRWPGFGALVALLLARTDLDIVLLVDDSSDVTTPPRSDRVHTIAGRIPFDDFEGLVTFCAAFVGNDSGPKHLAALRGAKVVSLHMARLNWNEWGQEMGGSIISRRVPCAGCAISHDAEDCGKDFACIRHIQPEEVFDAVMGQLGASSVTATPPALPRTARTTG